MSDLRGEDFVCPHCQADLPAGSKFCPECGSDETTGWSEDTYLDGVSLPDDDDPPPESPDAAPGIHWGMAMVSLLLLGLAAWAFLVGFP